MTRKINLVSYCRGIDGPKKYTTGGPIDLCSHPECYHCRGLEKAFKDEVEKMRLSLPNKDISAPYTKPSSERGKLSLADLIEAAKKVFGKDE